MTTRRRRIRREDLWLEELNTYMASQPTFSFDPHRDWPKEVTDNATVVGLNGEPKPEELWLLVSLNFVHTSKFAASIKFNYIRQLARGTFIGPRTQIVELVNRLRSSSQLTPDSMFVVGKPKDVWYMMGPDSLRLKERVMQFKRLTKDVNVDPEIALQELVSSLKSEHESKEPAWKAHSRINQQNAARRRKQRQKSSEDNK